MNYLTKHAVERKTALSDNLKAHIHEDNPVSTVGYLMEMMLLYLKRWEGFSEALGGINGNFINNDVHLMILSCEELLCEHANIENKDISSILDNLELIHLNIGEHLTHEEVKNNLSKIVSSIRKCERPN